MVRLGRGSLLPATVHVGSGNAFTIPHHDDLSSFKRLTGTA